MRTSRVLDATSTWGLASRFGGNLGGERVLLRETAEAGATGNGHDSALPWRSVMVMMVLLKEA